MNITAAVNRSASMKVRIGRVVWPIFGLLASLLMPLYADAALAFDASAEGTGTTTFTWTHTPVGTPRGAFIFCIADTSATDVFSGAIYGGVAATRIASASDTADEPAFVEGYFLGASIPTGAQSVECTVSSGTTAKHGVSFTVTAAANTELAGTGSCTVNENAGNPSCSITGIAGASYAAAATFSGQSTEGGVTAGTGFTIGPSNDFGVSVSTSERATTEQASGDWTVAFTAGADDVALVGIAIQEAASGSGFPPSSLTLLGVGAQ